MKTIAILCFSILVMIQVRGQDHSGSYLHGTVTTVSGDKMEGMIRWGKEEVFWSDLLNATKRSNPYIQHLSQEDRKYIESGESHWLTEIINEAIEIDAKGLHSFSAPFGAVEWIKASGGIAMEVKMRSGDTWMFRSGSNDLGATIRVYGKDGKEEVIPWERVDQVNFSQAPAGFRDPFGGPLWGKVETLHGTFTGRVEWDHDERVGSDMLDGTSEGKELSIPFSDIRAISREGRGSYVVLKDGNSLFLSGSNDVDAENRGIIVFVPRMGMIDVPWEEFQRVTFIPESAVPQTYASFEGARALRGKVERVDGTTLAGDIVYDLDEAMSFEMLNGRQELSEWEIPFSGIASIKPKNYKYSQVVLKNGSELLLGRMQDVSEANDGILVFPGTGDPIYVPWEKISQIRFE